MNTFCEIEKEGQRRPPSTSRHAYVPGGGGRRGGQEETRRGPRHGIRVGSSDECFMVYSLGLRVEG